MGKKRSSGPRAGVSREQPSLIPTIKSEEQRLEELMENAHREAAEIVASATVDAERLLTRTDGEIPPLLERERAARAGSLQSAAEEERTRSAGLLVELRASAARRMDKAVDAIVSRVWPLGRP